MPLDRSRPRRSPIDTGHAGDDAQLAQLQEMASLVTPRRWTHYLFFTDEVVVHEVSTRLDGDWQVAVLPDGEGWTLQLTRDGVTVSIAAVTKARRELTLLAESFGGEYDGWRAWQ